MVNAGLMIMVDDDKWVLEWISIAMGVLQAHWVV